MDNAANKSVCNDSRIFIGPVVDYNFSLDTANVNWGLDLNTGPIRISWEKDSGEIFADEFQEVVHNPSSPSNIMYVGRVGQHFVSIDYPLTNDGEGTWVKSCASYIEFTW